MLTTVYAHFQRASLLAANLQRLPTFIWRQSNNKTNQKPWIASRSDLIGLCYFEGARLK